jgi:hypothetical protein
MMTDPVMTDLSPPSSPLKDATALSGADEDRLTALLACDRGIRAAHDAMIAEVVKDAVQVAVAQVRKAYDACVIKAVEEALDDVIRKVKFTMITDERDMMKNSGGRGNSGCGGSPWMWSGPL